MYYQFILCGITITIIWLRNALLMFNRHIATRCRTSLNIKQLAHWFQEYPIFEFCSLWMYYVCICPVKRHNSTSVVIICSVEFILRHKILICLSFSTLRWHVNNGCSMWAMAHSFRIMNTMVVENLATKYKVSSYLQACYGRNLSIVYRFQRL